MIRNGIGLNTKVVKSFRAGKKTEGKPRTLVMTLDNYEHKMEIDKA